MSSTSLSGGNLVDDLPPVASRQNKIKGQIYKFECRFGFVLEICTFNLSEIFFKISECGGWQGVGKHLYLKARRRDNDSSILCHGLIFDDHEIDDSMAYTAFKMIIFQQFRHALTRHDPKTYIP